MGKYMLKRIVYIVLVFFILSFLLFMIYNMLPVDKAAEYARAEILANKQLDYQERYEFWQKKLGTNGTKIERYLRWIGVYPKADGTFDGMLQGNFGDSSKFNQPVSEVIVEPMKNTIFINIFATRLGLGITIPLGIFCAVKRGSKRDVGVQVGTIVGYSLPTFIIAILFIWLFAGQGLLFKGVTGNKVCALYEKRHAVENETEGFTVLVRTSVKLYCTKTDFSFGCVYSFSALFENCLNGIKSLLFFAVHFISPPKLRIFHGKFAFATFKLKFFTLRGKKAYFCLFALIKVAVKLNAYSN